MQEIQYQGEMLWPGYVGYAMVALAFGGALLTLLANLHRFYRGDDPQNSWLRLARRGFYGHALGILGIIVMMFYLIYHHAFEYHYIWSHSSLSLPTHYMISAFWEGQEGSFLLWAFWHAVLGLLLIRFAGKHWEAPVMSVVALAQITLVSMLLGISVGEAQIGSNPFILLRDAMSDAPIFNQANYLSFIKDGQGLNPLLQNYWMVIHPPILFLGFAATIVPFAYAIAGLMRGAYGEWVKPALPWAAFGAGILGAGILMGGAWAYEALNFGGYWAWDPVENAALVPWLMLVAGLHTMVIYNRTGRALITSLFFIAGSFLLVLYATFLTRSGILGDSSVHSFTDLGLSGQLLAFILIFLSLTAGLLVWRWKHIPAVGQEESLTSREFWMFVGAWVLVISSFQVILSTSIPVFNKIPGLNLAPPTDPIHHYNKFQLPFALVVALLTGAGQYFRYRKTGTGVLTRRLLVSGGTAVVLSVGAIYLFDLSNILYIALLATGVYALVGNAEILGRQLLSRKLGFSGASVAHIGFALLLIGALVSSAKQDVISINRAGVDYGEGFDDQAKRENIFLPKGKRVQMANYLVTYMGDSASAPNTYYKVRYERLNQSGDVVETFVLKPHAQINPDMGGLIASPDTRHYANQDIYTHVTSVPKKDAQEEDASYTRLGNRLVKLGDTLHVKDYIVEVKSIDQDPDSSRIPFETFDVAVAMKLLVHSADGSYPAEPIFVVQGGTIHHVEDEVSQAGLRFVFESVRPAEDQLELAIWKKDQEVPDYIIMKAIVFPWINLLWAGSVLMVVGFTISMVQRRRELKRKTTRKRVSQKTSSTQAA